VRHRVGTADDVRSSMEIDRPEWVIVDEYVY
jgi:hypothetical protein